MAEWRSWVKFTDSEKRRMAEKGTITMFNINQVLLAGFLTADAELRYTATQKPVLTFRMATNKKVKDKDYTQYHTVVLWNDAEDYGALLKGDFVQVVGELHTRTYEKNGEKRYITEVVAMQLTVTAQTKKDKGSNFENFGEDENIPF